MDGIGGKGEAKDSARGQRGMASRRAVFAVFLAVAGTIAVVVLPVALCRRATFRGYYVSTTVEEHGYIGVFWMHGAAYLDLYTGETLDAPHLGLGEPEECRVTASVAAQCAMMGRPLDAVNVSLLRGELWVARKCAVNLTEAGLFASTYSPAQGLRVYEAQSGRLAGTWIPPETPTKSRGPVRVSDTELAVVNLYAPSAGSGVRAELGLFDLGGFAARGLEIAQTAALDDEVASIAADTPDLDLQVVRAGQRLVGVFTGGRTGLPSVLIRVGADGEVGVFPGPRGKCSLSPDCSGLAVYDRGIQGPGSLALYRLDVDSMELEEVLRREYVGLYGNPDCWSPDGRFYATCSMVGFQWMRVGAYDMQAGAELASRVLAEPAKPPVALAWIDVHLAEVSGSGE